VVEEIENVIDTSPAEEFFQTNGPSTNKMVGRLSAMFARRGW
jgi:hypothetical protein